MELKEQKHGRHRSERRRNDDLVRPAEYRCSPTRRAGRAGNGFTASAVARKRSPGAVSWHQEAV
jgi:hypothetical protein